MRKNSNSFQLKPPTCLLSLLLICLLLPACNMRDVNSTSSKGGNTDHPDAPLQDEHQRRENTPGTDTMSFEVAFDHFFAALQASDTTRLQQFIDPELGVWLIEQPGAMPKMTHVKRLTSFKREYQDRSFLTVREEMQQCNLSEEPFPTFDCADMEGEKSGYSKDGCFAWKADKFRKSGFWNYASLSDEELLRINNTLPLVQKSVLHTKTSFEFHFGYVNSHWCLLFAKLIYPCSA